MPIDSKIKPGNRFDRDNFLIHTMGAVGSSRGSSILPSMHAYMMVEGIKNVPVMRDGKITNEDCLFLARYDIYANGGGSSSSSCCSGTSSCSCCSGTSSSSGGGGYLTNIKRDSLYIPLKGLTDEQITASYNHFRRGKNDRAKPYATTAANAQILDDNIAKDQIRIARGIAQAFLTAEEGERNKPNPQPNIPGNTHFDYFEIPSALEHFKDLKPTMQGQTYISQFLQMCEMIVSELKETPTENTDEATKPVDINAFAIKAEISANFLKLLNKRIRFSAKFPIDPLIFKMEVWSQTASPGDTVFVLNDTTWSAHIKKLDDTVSTHTVKDASNALNLLNDKEKTSDQKSEALNKILNSNISTLFPDFIQAPNPASFFKKNLAKMKKSGYLNDNTDLIKFRITGSTGRLFRRSKKRVPGSPVNCAEYNKDQLADIGITTSCRLKPDAQTDSSWCTIL